MNDFDTTLELELRRLLDPIVAQRPPARRGRNKRTPESFLSVPAVELAAETIPVIAPASRLLS